jgi:hypothetical protein
MGEGGEAGEALSRVQDFDPSTLVREGELGKKFAMREAVEPAKQVIDFFKLIRPSQIAYFPPTQQALIRDQANGFYSLLESVLKFDIEESAPNPTEVKTNLIHQLQTQFQPIFNQLYPIISFSSIRSLDFSELERDARAATQAVKDSATTLLSDVNLSKESVETIVTEMRALAAEQGVGKQAIHFKNEADSHLAQALTWRKYTAFSAIALALYAVLSLFFHYIPGLDMNTASGSAQVAVSKVLIFAVIAYVLFLCARNFMSHTHNQIINRHRQNALATFTALAEATSDAASSDIVLSHAAACIFSPQETGYAKQDHSMSEGMPALQILPRIGQSLAGGSR